ncbi:MAG: rhomboid family intramembrane serine protease [Campylobacteraceae bacterium]|nr:rhomboid family intramembrane serine protease [Campylobacteraceae bacterium]
MNFYRQPYVTYYIIALCSVFYLFQNIYPILSAYSGLNIYFINGFFWQPLTTMFTHGHITHLFMNMVVLFQFGSIIESVRGRIFFLKLYFIGGILTSLLSFAYIYTAYEKFGEIINVIGASGAICVLIGWIAQKDSFNRKGLIIAILLISFLPMLIGLKVAWYAHLIGFGVGWAAGKISK